MTYGDFEAMYGRAIYAGALKENISATYDAWVAAFSTITGLQRRGGTLPPLNANWNRLTEQQISQLCAAAALILDT